jgi:hypothetical protein
LVIFASGSNGFVQSLFEVRFFLRRSRRAKASRVGVLRPDATASRVRNSAAEQVEAAHAASATPPVLTEIIADKGYHSNQTMIDLAALGVRSYIAEPERGRRHWTTTSEAQAPVYGNRRRVRGARGKRLMRCRGEYVGRSFAHVYDTGGMRHTHLRGHQNILKRLLVQASAFNLGVFMRQAFGRGTPRGLQGGHFDPPALEIAFGMLVASIWVVVRRVWRVSRSLPCVLSTSWTPVRECWAPRV